MSREFSASELLDIYLGGYPEVRNFSYWRPVLRILRIFPLAFELGGFGLLVASPLIGLPFLAGIGIGLPIAFLGGFLCHGSRLFNPVERLVLVDHLIFVKRIGRNEIIARDQVREMTLMPASNADYDDLQQTGRFFEATIRAKGKRMKVNCWLLVAESDAQKLLRWLNPR